MSNPQQTALVTGASSGMGTIAHQLDLGLSERTLQRRITEEGTTFRALLLEARRSLGRQLLESPDCDIQEVAFLLGYQDANAFHRAFKEWEGVSPARWRALQGGASTAQA